MSALGQPVGVSTGCSNRCQAPLVCHVTAFDFERPFREKVGKVPATYAPRAPALRRQPADANHEVHEYSSQLRWKARWRMLDIMSPLKPQQATGLSACIITKSAAVTQNTARVAAEPAAAHQTASLPARPQPPLVTFQLHHDVCDFTCRGSGVVPEEKRPRPSTAPRRRVAATTAVKLGDNKSASSRPVSASCSRDRRRVACEGATPPPFVLQQCNPLRLPMGTVPLPAFTLQGAVRLQAPRHPPHCWQGRHQMPFIIRHSPQSARV